MKKEQIENRINAIENIIQAAVQGEKIKMRVQADMDKAGVIIPQLPEEIIDEGEYYDEDEYYDAYEEAKMKYEEDRIDYIDFLNKREKQEDWKQMDEFSRKLQLQIAGFTLEDISNYIQINTGKPVNLDIIPLWDCKETESDSWYGDSVYDDDIIAYYDGEYEFNDEDINDEDQWISILVEAILEKGISLDNLPEKLLFNISFVSEYIEQVSLIRARETEKKGITPQEIEDALSSVKLGNFINSTGEIKENAKGEQAITTEDKNKYD